MRVFNLMKVSVDTGFNFTMIQVSMDGFGVSWLLDEKIAAKREEMNLSKLVHIGSCSFHNIHGDFKTGVTEKGWNTKVLLKRKYTLLHDT